MDDNGYVNIDKNIDIDLRAQRIAILRGITTILMDIIYFFSSSENEKSEDEIEHVMQLMEKRKKLPRLENYVENIVFAYNSEQFKSHFRLFQNFVNCTFSINII